jgi:hypothetical protein
VEIRYDHRNRLASYQCLLTAETIDQLRTLATRYVVPAGNTRTDVAAVTTHGQLLVSAQAVVGTNNALLVHGNVASASHDEHQIENLSRHRVAP